MLDFLFASDFSGPATAALWATVASAAAAVLLLAYTIELRVRRVYRERRRRRIIERWRSVIAKASTSSAPLLADELPRLPGTDRREFLRLWNQTRNMLEGAAADRLIALADGLGIREFAQQHFRHSSLADRITAIQTLGHLRSEKDWSELAEACDDSNTLISITAAEALVEIDPQRAALFLIPKIARRRDWPKTHVFRMLQKCGSEAISEPLYRTIRAVNDSDAAHLLQFVALTEFDVCDSVTAELLRDRKDPTVLAAALKICSGYQEVPRIEELAQHPLWFVRMQAARALGRMGTAKQQALLERLLCDAEWWVRYRAGRALARLPGFDAARLRAIQARLNDGFARDILEQVLAEERAA